MSVKNVSDVVTATFSATAQQVIAVAEYKALERGEWVSPLHLLYALCMVRSGDGIDQTFDQCDQVIELAKKLATDAEKDMPQYTATRDTDVGTYAPHTKKAIVLAHRAARQSVIGSKHLLKGLFFAHNNAATKILQTAGIGPMPVAKGSEVVTA